MHGTTVKNWRNEVYCEDSSHFLWKPTVRLYCESLHQAHLSRSLTPWYCNLWNTLVSGQIKYHFLQFVIFNSICALPEPVNLSEHIYRMIKKSLCTWWTIPTQLMSWRWPTQNTFRMWTVLYWTRSSRTQFDVSINIWRLAGDTLNITCIVLYCNHQVNRDFLITLYFSRPTLQAVHEKYLFHFLCCFFGIWVGYLR
jgi:hypothetical protein